MGEGGEDQAVACIFDIKGWLSSLVSNQRNPN